MTTSFDYRLAKRFGKKGDVVDKEELEQKGSRQGKLTSIASIRGVSAASSSEERLSEDVVLEETAIPEETAPEESALEKPSLGELPLEEQLVQLQGMHRGLDTRIQELHEFPYRDQLEIQRLKKQKLRIKESIEYVKNKIIPDWNA